MKQVGKFYMYTAVTAGCITLGYDMADTKRMELVEGMGFGARTLKITKDVSLAMIWPITGPKAIKNFVDNFDGPPYD